MEQDEKMTMDALIGIPVARLVRVAPKSPLTYEHVMAAVANTTLEFKRPATRPATVEEWEAWLETVKWPVNKAIVYKTPPEFEKRSLGSMLYSILFYCELTKKAEGKVMMKMSRLLIKMYEKILGHELLLSMMTVVANVKKPIGASIDNAIVSLDADGDIVIKPFRPVNLSVSSANCTLSASDSTPWTVVSHFLKNGQSINGMLIQNVLLEDPMTRVTTFASSVNVVGTGKMPGVLFNEHENSGYEPSWCKSLHAEMQEMAMPVIKEIAAMMDMDLTKWDRAQHCAEIVKLKYSAATRRTGTITHITPSGKYKLGPAGYKNAK